MALPESRDETLVDGGPFPFTLGNSLQDQIIAAKHGEVILTMRGGAVEGNLDQSLAEHWQLITSPGIAFAVATSPVIGNFSPPLLVGHVIRSVTLFAFTGTGGNDLTIELYDQDPTSDAGMVAVSTGGWGTDTTNGTVSTFDSVTISGTDLAVLATRTYSLRVTSDNNMRLLQVNWTIAKLT